MAVFKCKMCGGDLVVDEESKVVECEYCGTAQTVPSGDDEKKARLFNRANRLRLGNDFDKAMSIYENIIAEYPEEAEAFWGLCLCKYGIEYVDDPATAKKIPTCHRTLYESIFEDDDFEQALEYSDTVARTLYRNEAKEIDRLQKAILEIVESEEPYDIFICYKETDENGDRTNDSVLAQDMYDALTAKGYRVFFSRVSLEDKLGREYEPYIFAALNSAKVMLAVGTDYENFNAAWVKNEWSRFLDLMKKDKQKVLIPCYRDIDAYDMPPEFKNLQGQDMGKVGFMQDLVRGINKIMGKGGTATPVQETAAQQAVGPNVAALLDRGQMALEDKEWDKAKEFFDQVLNMDSRCAGAYLGIAMADYELGNLKTFEEEYVSLGGTLHDDKNIQRAISFSSDEKKRYYEGLEKRRQEIIDRKKAEEEEKERKRQKEAQEEARRHQEEQRIIFERKKHEIEEARKTVHDGIIAVGADHTIALCLNSSRVYATGRNDVGQCNVEGWENIIAVAAGDNHSVGLLENGKVVATGKNDHGQCDVEEWSGIKEISAGTYHTVGLCADGRVIATGRNNSGQCEVTSWQNIIAVSAGYYRTIGLYADGSVVSTQKYDHSIESWKDIIAVATGENHIVGLRADGTVVAVGANNYKQCNVGDWRDIIAITAGQDHTIGIKSNGKVVATGYNQYKQCNIYGWSHVIAVAAGKTHTVGVRSDGIVEAAGMNSFNKCHVENWRCILTEVAMEMQYEKACMLMETNTEVVKDALNIFRMLGDYKDSKKLKVTCEDKLEKIRKYDEEQSTKRLALVREEQELRRELANLKGMFSGKRKKEIEERLKIINKEIQAIADYFKER